MMHIVSEGEVEGQGEGYCVAAALLFDMREQCVSLDHISLVHGWLHAHGLVEPWERLGEGLGVALSRAQ